MNSPLIGFVKKHLYQKNIFVREHSIVPPPKEPVVTILNAASGIGKNVALLLKQNPLIGELRLYDKDGTVCGIAEDLSHIDTKIQIKSFVGPTVLKDAVTDANIVVTVGGEKESSKETFKCLFDKNVDDVRFAALNLAEFNPKAMFCIAKQPIEALVPLVSEEYKKAGVYDWTKIFGVTNAASMRANSICAANGNQKPIDIVCPIVGGLSKECLVAVLSQVKPKCYPMLTSDVQKQIINSEDEILKLYGDCNGLKLMPALGISRFINTLLKACNGDTNCVECAFVRQTGHIGSFLPYMTSIVKLCRHGILSTHMPKLNSEEGYFLQKASSRIKEYIQLGESFVVGEPQTINETPFEERKNKLPTHIYINKQPQPSVTKTT